MVVVDALLAMDRGDVRFNGSYRRAQIEAGGDGLAHKDDQDANKGGNDDTRSQRPKAEPPMRVAIEAQVYDLRPAGCAGWGLATPVWSADRSTVE